MLLLLSTHSLPVSWGMTSPFYWIPPMQSVQVTNNDASPTGSGYKSRGAELLSEVVE